jgi:hypothetical protein
MRVESSPQNLGDSSLWTLRAYYYHPDGETLFLETSLLPYRYNTPCDSVKDPVNATLAPNWTAYEPGIVGIAPVPTLAEIAYQGNVGFNDFIQPVQPISKVGTRSLYSKPTRSSLKILFL